MNLIVIGTLACEIGFWVMLAAGLITRYVLRLRRMSNILLFLVPMLDIALLALITWDLLVNQATAHFAHGLGAVYLGFTVAFGHQIIQRVDAWFSHRFADGPAPIKPPKSGVPQLRYEWGQWLRMLVCAVIASAILGAIVLLVGDVDRTSALVGWFGRIWLVTAIWLVGWPVWISVSYLIRGERTPVTEKGQ
ncbi:MAG: hypothetical protein ACTIJ6_07065 [Leucobacter sp.]